MHAKMPAMTRNTLHTSELIAVGQASMLKALNGVSGCQACDKTSWVRFETVLQSALGKRSDMEYFLCCPAECPNCAAPILESTLVRLGSFPACLELLPQQTDVVFVDEPTLLEAQSFITGCQHCGPERAEFGFDQILDNITGCDPTVTEYVICHAARCPRCDREVMEKTLVIAE
jgi:hypothetical protein